MESRKFINRPKVMDVIEVTEDNLISFATDLAYRIVFEKGKPCMEIMVGGQIQHRACVGDFIVYTDDGVRVETSETIAQNYIDISNAEPQISDLIISENAGVAIEPDSYRESETYSNSDGDNETP